MLGVVVVTAASVAAGRIASGSSSGGQKATSLAEMDQRYYTVTSAARLLANALAGKTVSITQTVTGNEFMPDFPIKDGSENAKASDAKCGEFLEKIAASWYECNAILNQNFSITISDNNDTEIRNLDITGIYSMEPSGKLIFEIGKSKDGSNISDIIPMTLTFMPVTTQWMESRIIAEDPEIGYIEIEWTNHATIRWELNAVRGRERNES